MCAITNVYSSIHLSGAPEAHRVQCFCYSWYTCWGSPWYFFKYQTYSLYHQIILQHVWFHFEKSFNAGELLAEVTHRGLESANVLNVTLEFIYLYYYIYYWMTVSKSKKHCSPWRGLSLAYLWIDIECKLIHIDVCVPILFLRRLQTFRACLSLPFSFSVRRCWSVSWAHPHLCTHGTPNLEFYTWNRTPWCVPGHGSVYSAYAL